MTQLASVARVSLPWRDIDIITAAVIGVAVGLTFVIWNIIGGAGHEVVNALTPGLGGLVASVWFLGDPFGAYIIRKPSVAIFVEVIAATVSALIGNQWGITILYSGSAQGLGAELVFLILAYKSYNLATVVISGLTAGVGARIFELFIDSLAEIFEFNVIYLISSVLSGIALADLLTYFLAKALAAIGTSGRSAIGRERHNDI